MERAFREPIPPGLSLADLGVLVVQAIDVIHEELQKTPRQVGGIGTQSAYVIVDDVDAHHARAGAAGAEIVMEIKDEEYGGRGFSCPRPARAPLELRHLPLPEWPRYVDPDVTAGGPRVVDFAAAP